MTEYSSPGEHSSWIPEPHQLQLLQCALGREKRVLDVWEGWLSAARSPEKIDPSCQRLLPLVTWNLKRLGWRGAVEWNTLSGTLKKTWFQNQLILHQMARLAGAFARQGIPLMFLKGAAMITGYYPDPRLRPMGDIDILVPRHQRAGADHILQTFRWTHLNRSFSSEKGSIQRILFNSCTYIHPEGPGCDLHWNIFKHYNFSGADNPVWESPRQVRVKEQPILILQPEEQLLHTLEHALYWENNRPVYWVADALMVLKSCPNLDWDYFFTRSRRIYLFTLVREMVQYLNDYFPGFFPGRFSLPPVPSSPTEIELKLYRNLCYKNPGSWRRANRYLLRTRIFIKENRSESGLLMLLRLLLFMLRGLVKRIRSIS